MLVAALLIQAAVELQGGEVTESSGLVVSTSHPGVLWTINDSGDGPYLYAFDEKGRPKATVRVRNAQALDWEDLASGPFPGKPGRWLYAADIGDNGKLRPDVSIYAVPEPKLGKSSREKPLPSAESIRLRLKYPDGPHNAETLLCDPRDGRLILVTKEESGTSGIYQVVPGGKLGQTQVLKKVGEFRVPGRSRLVTGGTFRPDGGALALVTYTDLIELKGPAFFSATPRVRSQPGLRQLEAVAYSRDGRSLWMTSEGDPAPLVRLAAVP